MPHVDQRSGELVIRIVYDGAAEAGKTTNIRQLTERIALQRRGVAESPGTTGERTEYFDWLDFSGGFIDGRRVRCQLVSVPGQPEVLHRRRYLLEAADVIVYVADARPECVRDNRDNLAVTRRILEELNPKAPIGIVVQANKQDLDRALSPEALASALELPPSVPVVPSSASAGEGVLQTFVLAVRLATDRVRAMFRRSGPEDLTVLHETPGALYEAMIRLEPRASAPGRRNAGASELLHAFGPELDVSAGHVWPPVKGRGLMANVSVDGLHAPEFVAAWAPADAVELRTPEGCAFHSTERWVFSEEASARNALLALVRRQLENAELLFDGRALFLAAEGPRWRLWVFTARADTLRDVLMRALSTRDVKTMERLVSRARAIEHWGLPEGVAHADALDVLCLSGDRICALTVHEGDATGGHRRNLAERLFAAAAEHAAHDVELSAWLKQHCVALLENSAASR